MAAKKLYQQQLSLIGIVVAVRLISCSDDAMFPGQARPDDPHACVWFEPLTGPTIFRCCDGYFKTSESKLTENCIECPVGSYGYYCKNYCTCENGGTCNTVDGSCHCSSQYFGSRCQFSCNCKNGATCMSDGSCSCANGFYGELCDRQCECPVNSECDSKTGECVCQNGFYGESCLPCNCSNNEQCDQINGLCSCIPGFYGENCDKHCSCFNGAYCDMDHLDLCTCAFGWIGSNCTDCDSEKRKSDGLSYCEDKCLHCYNGVACSFQNGDCECSPGWQGNRCDKSCDAGFYGINCSEVCHCEHGSCNHVDGSCWCEIGWTGQRCEVPCQNCALCRENICMSCKAGWTGENCNDKCEPGFYGNACLEKCPECDCAMSCDHVSGRCLDVVRCEEQKCKYPNARVCMEKPFELECQDGWTGRLCNDKTDNGKNVTNVHNNTVSLTGDDSFPYYIWIVIAVIVVIACIVSIAIVILIVRKRRTVQRNPEYCEATDTYDLRQDRRTSDYENVLGNSINNDNQQLRDFSYTQYQKHYVADTQF
ncbi:multiple epidermal growth factor-like domains protein 11 [Ptychodera flava]|uniref:multiple epidermal growth factor-like domains protein 11 n=1 Tax=Ptychodera flava TaxID=63121 RepID=UPI00396A7B21